MARRRQSLRRTEGRDDDEMRIGRNGCWVGEGLQRRAAVFRQYKSGKPDPRYEGHPQKKCKNVRMKEM